MVFIISPPLTPRWAIPTVATQERLLPNDEQCSHERARERWLHRQRRNRDHDNTLRFHAPLAVQRAANPTQSPEWNALGGGDLPGTQPADARRVRSHARLAWPHEVHLWSLSETRCDPAER